MSTSTNKLVPTSISLTVDAECVTKPDSSYSAATGSDFSRWNWQCPSVKPGTAFQVDVDYSVTTTGGTALGISESVRVSGQTHPASLKRMRYQALMPYWFYSNDWYLSAFAAVSPSDAPSVVMPCGSATKLTVGPSTNVAALVMLAGSRLPKLPAAPTQTRPSSVVSNYLEAPNVSGGTNCVWSW